MPTEEKSDKRDNSEQIKQEAKKILDKFAKALERVKQTPEFYVERDEDRRVESSGSPSDDSFRKIFFENAPSVKNECIEAEKGVWK